MGEPSRGRTDGRMDGRMDQRADRRSDRRTGTSTHLSWFAVRGDGPDGSRALTSENAQPIPQAGSMSGDPIVSVNGLRVKFDLPSGQTTLMWGADDLDIFSKANVVTPDKQSQWFSDFILVVNGHRAAHIQRNEIKVAYKDGGKGGNGPHIGVLTCIYGYSFVGVPRGTWI